LFATPYIDIHTHRYVSAADIFAVENIFAANIPEFRIEKDRLFSGGIHPWHVNELTLEKDISSIDEFSVNPNVFAVGETGLDRLCKVPFKLQEEVFTNQLEIAGRHGKPLIVHCVKALPETISIYQKTKSKSNLIFHGFNNNLKIAVKLLDQGFYLSFGQALLNQKSNAYLLFNQIPDESIFLETDDSGISIEEIYAEAARIKKISVMDLKEILYNNFQKCMKGTR
jgi:TatD DNase family protein